MGIHMQMRSDRGTSVTETILLTWLLIVFFAAALQIFVMNESLYRTVTAAHAKMFEFGFQHNHWEYDGDDGDWCVTNDDDYWNTYNTDEHAKVILNRQDFPEIQVQVLGMFRWWGGKQTVDIHSNYPGRVAEPAKGCPDYPCKKLKMAAGPAGPTDYGEPTWGRPWNIPAHGRLYCKAVMEAGHAIGGGIDKIQECSSSGWKCLF
jgi:hypothetical protein